MFQYETWSKTQSTTNFLNVFFVFFSSHFENIVNFKITIKSKFNNDFIQIK